MKDLLKKIFCLHDIELVTKDEYSDGLNLIFVCKKCGKVKIIRL